MPFFLPFRPERSRRGGTCFLNCLNTIAVFLLCCATPFVLNAQQPVEIEHGTFAIHLLQRTIGSEEYTLTDFGAYQQLKIVANTNDRGIQRTVTTTLNLRSNLSPLRLEQSNATGNNSLTEIDGNKVTTSEGEDSRTFTRPPISFLGAAEMPAAAQMFMMRYWLVHHRPLQLPLLRSGSSTPPLAIRLVGHDVFTVQGSIVRLTRYTVAHLLFGREVLWMNEDGRVAAIMTFAGGLPREFVLDEYKPAFDQLIQSGVRQQMLDLADLTRSVRPLAMGSFAIVGARLIDATGAPPVENSAVVIRNGRVAAAGPASTVRIPRNLRVIHAEGKSLLPGLWEMNAHFSGAAVGPALLAAGVTTARDTGGEFRFLTEARRAIDADHQLGPRLLLAGLIGGGVFTADTPEEGIVAVNLYADARYDQVAPSPQLQPAILRAITAQANKRGLSIATGIPKAQEVDAAHIAEDLDRALYVQTGMTPMQAIQSLTIDPARAMHRDDDSGTIEPGKRADLVLIDGDPLADISALHRVVSVVTAGRMYSTRALAASVGLQH